jgi:hypothetical protein
MTSQPVQPSINQAGSGFVGQQSVQNVLFLILKSIFNHLLMSIAFIYKSGTYIYAWPV